MVTPGGRAPAATVQVNGAVASPCAATPLERKFFTNVLLGLPRSHAVASQDCPVVSTVIGVGPLIDVPVPVIEITCGLVGALSTSDIVAVRVPVVPGENERPIVQEAPGASVMARHRLVSLGTRKS